MGLADELRELSIMADNTLLAANSRIHLTGKSTMTCLPDLWQVEIYNLQPEDLAAIRRAEKIAVIGKRNSVLCEGKPMDIMRTALAGREITTILIVDGDAFWRASVAVSVRSGADAEQTVRLLLSKCTSPIPLSAFPSVRMRLHRGQVFYGRVANAIADFAKAFSCRAFTFRNCLHVIKLGEGTAETTLTSDDFLSDPTVMDECATVSTDVIGLMVGRRVTVEDDQIGGVWRLVAQTIDADSFSGSWKCDLTLVNESKLLSQSESRWEGIL